MFRRERSEHNNSGQSMRAGFRHLHDEGEYSWLLGLPKLSGACLSSKVERSARLRRKMLPAIRVYAGVDPSTDRIAVVYWPNAAVQFRLCSSLPDRF